MTIEEIAKQAIEEEHIDVFPMAEQDLADYAEDSCWYDEEGNRLEPGVYAWQCFPGCMPEGDPIMVGTLEDSEEAILENVVEYFFLASLDEDDHVVALMSHLIKFDNERAVEVFGNVSEAPYGEHYYRYGNREYLVLTDDEADSAADEYGEQLLDELLHEVPHTLRYYFDTDEYLEDTRSENRLQLASYDGDEHEEGDFYIYRTS